MDQTKQCLYAKILINIGFAIFTLKEWWSKENKAEKDNRMLFMIDCIQ